MSSLKNSHIQGDLTISSSSNLNDIGSGILFTDFIKETTSSSGLSISDTVLNITSSIINPTITLKNDISETSIFQLNSSTDSSGNGVKSLTIINNSGDTFLQSKGGKGISIAKSSGDVLISSTTEAIDSNTASLILKGGLSVNKSLIVDKQILGSDGYHSLINTQSSQQVLQIKNTSSSGFSSTDYYDYNNNIKLQIGYGNDTTPSPYTGQAYIQSISGTLLFRGNSVDSFKIMNTGSVQFINNTSSTSSISASVMLYGGLSISNTTDAVSVTNGGTITTAGGVSIAKQLFLGNTLNMNIISEPSAPVSGTKTFYIDTLDNLLKSKNDTNIVTTYQPTTTKGDITVHNGSTQVRVPVGNDGYTLQSDSTSSTGVKWAFANSSTTVSNKSYLNNAKYTSTIDNPIGSFFNLIYPEVDYGSSCNLFFSKSFPNLNGVSVRLNNNKSLTTNGDINYIWSPYRGVRLRNSYSEADGDYVIINNNLFQYSYITLSGTTWNQIFSDLTGVFCFSIYTLSGGPSGTFILTKNISSNTTGNIFKIVSSPGTSNNQLEIRWSANTGIEIRKNNSNNDNIYKFTDNFQTSIKFTVTLSGTANTQIDINLFNYYENKSFILKVVGQTSGSPSAIFIVSKNTYNINTSVTSITSPGVSTSELLQFIWSPNSLPSIKKSGLGYDGNYDLYLSKLY